MENIFIAIVTDDKEYGRSLSLGMLNVCRGFIIRIFTAEEFLTVKKEYDLVLWDGNEVSRVYGGRIIYLAEKPSEVAKNLAEKRFSIYKYSTAAAIVAAVFEIYEALTGRRAVNLRKQDVRIFAFTSCRGGTGCTTITMAAAQEMCRFQGKNVLYLSFEELESTGEYMRNDAGIKGAAVYLYELFNKTYTGQSNIGTSTDCIPFLDKYIIRDDFGVEAFAPGYGRNPLRELNVGELNKFLASLIDSGRFDVILMDMGQWLSKTAIKCLELAEKVIVVNDMTRSGMRYDSYICHVINNGGEAVMDKVIKVNNDKRGIMREDIDMNNDEMYEDAVMISRCDNFISDGKHISFVLEEGFGHDINVMVNALVEP